MPASLWFGLNRHKPGASAFGSMSTTEGLRDFQREGGGRKPPGYIHFYSSAVGLVIFPPSIPMAPSGRGRRERARDWEGDFVLDFVGY